MVSDTSILCSLLWKTIYILDLNVSKDQWSVLRCTLYRESRKSIPSFCWTVGLLTLVNQDDDICALEVFSSPLTINILPISILPLFIPSISYIKEQKGTEKLWYYGSRSETYLANGYTPSQSLEPLSATLVTCSRFLSFFQTWKMLNPTRNLWKKMLLYWLSSLFGFRYGRMEYISRHSTEFSTTPFVTAYPLPSSTRYIYVSRKNNIIS